MRDTRQQDFTPGKQNGHARAPVIQSAAELMAKKFEPIRWVVPGILPEGLTGLGGKPKSGKSWLMLGTDIAIATGGETLGKKVEQGDVLYLALEDNERRMAGRLDQIIGFNHPPPRLALTYDWPRIDQGGVQHMENWIRSVKNPRLIEIDVLGKVRPPKNKDTGLYADDYAAVTPLKQLADMYKIGVRFAHHLSKRSEVDDLLDTFSGTTGLTGACDTLLVMRKANNATTLYGRGRDMQEIELALKFDEFSGTWTNLGNAHAAMMSDERKAILDAIDRCKVEPPTVTEIMRETGMSRANIHKMLSRMMSNGEVRKADIKGQHRYERARMPHNKAADDQ